ncbi:MAG TPA: hypothetical protein VFA07_07650 [Chthonomonadaceae bacterium]|nr:hypothetical protein [Chthonomonadaceae bacterium]
MSGKGDDSDFRKSGRPRLVVVKPRGPVVVLSLGAALLSAIGLVLVTGLATSAWLFVIYPVLIGTLVASLGILALHLLHRL